MQEIHEEQGLPVKMDCLCASDRDNRCSRGCVFTEHRSGHSGARQQALQLKYITDLTWKGKMAIPSKSTILSGEIGREKNKQKKTWPSSMTRNTNVFRLFVMVRVHPKILQFDFSPSIIIPFGKHNAICSQKNYTTVLQKTNNLLALCLTEQHCQSARNHPF